MGAFVDEKRMMLVAEEVMSMLTIHKTIRPCMDSGTLKCIAKPLKSQSLLDIGKLDSKEPLILL